jgi:hypothetical protein
MNKYSNLSKDQMLEVCKIIHPDVNWKFHQIRDQNGEGTDDSVEFIDDDGDDDGAYLGFCIHRPPNQEIIYFYFKEDFDNDEIPPNKIKLIDKYLKSIKPGVQTNNKDFLNYLKLDIEARSYFITSCSVELAEDLKKLIKKFNIPKDYALNHKDGNVNVVGGVSLERKKFERYSLNQYTGYRLNHLCDIEVCFVGYWFKIFDLKSVEIIKHTLFGKKTTKGINYEQFDFWPFKYLYEEKITAQNIREHLVYYNKFYSLSKSDHLSSNEKKFLSDVIQLFNKIFNKFLEEQESRSEKLIQQKNTILNDLSKDSNGQLDLIENDFNKLIVKIKKYVLGIDKKYIHHFVKVSNFIKTKKQNIEKIYQSIQDTSSVEELDGRVNLLKNHVSS